MEGRSKRLFLIALLLGVVTALLIYIQMDRLQREAREEEELVPVVVAAQDIKAPARLTPDMLTVVEVTPQWRHISAAVDLGDVVGMWVSRDFLQGEQILSSLLVAGEKGDGLVYRIPEGRRALTIPVNPVTGVGGEAQVGDRVDVLVTLDEGLVGQDRTITLLQDIEILALGGDYREGGSSTVTLAVTPKQGEELTLADEKGRLRLVLRPAAATDRLSTGGVIPPNLLEGRQ